MKTKVPIEDILELRGQGLSYREIGRRVGLEHSGVRKRLFDYQRHGGPPKIGRPCGPVRPAEREEIRPQAKMKVYKISPEEIEARYGRPGQYPEKQKSPITYGYPDGGEPNSRHYLKREAQNE